MANAEYPISFEPLGALLREVGFGAIQVPEFQRAVTLRDDWVRTLLASVSLGYPIGAVMLLEAGHPEYWFGTRPVEGAPATSAVPQSLLVDGQHRVSALIQAFVAPGGVAATSGDGQSRRRYYLDLRKVVGGADRDAAIVSLPADQEPDSSLFGLNGALSAVSHLFPRPPGLTQPERSALEAVLSGVKDYGIPVIHLPMAATRWTIRVRGGKDGPALSDAFRVREP